MPAIDTLFLFGFLGIWIPQAFWAWLSFQAWKYSKNAAKELENMPVPDQWPVLSVLIPAYNEGVVIEDTLHAIAQQDYPVFKQAGVNIIGAFRASCRFDDHGDGHYGAPQ